MPIIVVNEKPNITHLPYAGEAGQGVFSFKPGQNTIEAPVWQAVKKMAGKSMAHYGTFLKPIGEDAPDKAIDFGRLNADDAIALAGGAMEPALLEGYVQAETSRKGGARKKVMESIEKQAAELRAIEEKKKAK